MAGVLDEGSIPVPSNMAGGRAFHLAGELDMLGSGYVASERGKVLDKGWLSKHRDFF